MGIRVPERVVLDLASTDDSTRALVGHSRQVRVELGHFFDTEDPTAVFDETQVTCQKGGPKRAGAECRLCPRFMGLDVAQEDITIRCRWYGFDPVGRLMTLADHVVAVSPETKAAEAMAVAQRENIDHLLVVEGENLHGVLSVRDLVEPGNATVQERMSETVSVIPPDAPMYQARSQMKELEVGCLPVVWQGELCGIITRTDMA